jgi:CheY-like chemotaxis protein
VSSGGDHKRSNPPSSRADLTLQEAPDPHRDLSGALHDVSNALTVMLGWVQEARDPEATRESVAYALDIIEQRARIARDLARRAIGGSAKFLDQDAQLDVTLGDAIEALSVMAQKIGVKVAQRGDARGIRIPAAGDVSQILTNLVMNAFAHAPPESTVTVVVDVWERSIAIDVADEGAGVPAARRKSIFEGDSTREGGAGVGLRYARALARAAGGDLDLVIDSFASLDDAVKSGARFRLTWPRVDTLPKPPVSVARMRVLEGTRILVIEDDRDVTDLLEASLGARGATVTIARSPAELTAALGSEHDAALIDLSPISADPRAAFDALRKASPNARLVVMTGSAEGLPQEVDPEGVRLVRKPFEVSEIVAALIEPRKA